MTRLPARAFIARAHAPCALAARALVARALVARAFAAFVAAALALSAAAAPASAQGVAVPGTQVIVRYAQSDSTWRALPLEGPLQVWRAKAGHCESAPLPRGYWLVTRNAEGHAELVAPSHTALPEGFPERVALRECDDGDALALHAPKAVIELLADTAGLVYVDD